MNKIILFIIIIGIIAFGIESPAKTDSEGNRYKKTNSRIEMCECEKHGPIEICECK